MISEISGNQLKSPVGLVLNAFARDVDRFFDWRISSHQRRQHGTDAGAADAIDFDAVLLQSAPDTKVRKAARTATGEHKTDRFACEQPGQARDIALQFRTEVNMRR